VDASLTEAPLLGPRGKQPPICFHGVCPVALEVIDQ